MPSIMVDAADIEWQATHNGALAGVLGGVRGVIRPHPVFRGFEAQIFTTAGAYGEASTLRTIEEAIAWVEEELLRLASRA